MIRLSENCKQTFMAGHCGAQTKRIKSQVTNYIIITIHQLLAESVRIFVMGFHGGLLSPVTTRVLFLVLNPSWYLLKQLRLLNSRTSLFSHIEPNHAKGLQGKTSISLLFDCCTLYWEFQRKTQLIRRWGWPWMLLRQCYDFKRAAVEVIVLKDHFTRQNCPQAYSRNHSQSRWASKKQGCSGERGLKQR